MPSYSIVFLDVDGTLLDSAHRVSPATRTLLRKLHDRGVPVVLASARPPKGLEPIYDQLEFRGPALCCAGALAVLPDQHILYDHGIPAATAARFEQTVLDGWPRLALSAYLYDAWLTPNPDDPAIRREADITGCQPLASALGSEAQRLGDVHKLLCIGPERDITDLQHQLTPRFPELTVLRSNPTYLEVVANGVCKEQTAAVLLDHFGLPATRAVACGDGEVDAGMLRMAGLGVAMGNAGPKVRAAADFVTATNEADGVFVALNRLRFTPPAIQ